jgi:hypothetical protein
MSLLDLFSIILKNMKKVKGKAYWVENYWIWLLISLTILIIFSLWTVVGIQTSSSLVIRL